VFRVQIFLACMHTVSPGRRPATDSSKAKRGAERLLPEGRRSGTNAFSSRIRISAFGRFEPSQLTAKNVNGS
jgi:hypothetical protein